MTSSPRPPARRPTFLRAAYCAVLLFACSAAYAALYLTRGRQERLRALPPAPVRVRPRPPPPRPSTSPRPGVKQLTFARKIGSGQYAKVYAGSWDVKWDTLGDGSAGGYGADKMRAYKVLDMAPSDFDGDMPHVVRELYCSAAGSAREGVVQFAHANEYAVVSILGNETLTNLLRHPMPLHVVRVLGRVLLREVAMVHAHGILHRDLKPDNVLISWHAGNTSSVDGLYWPRLDVADFSLSLMSPVSTDRYVITIWWRPVEVMLSLPYTSKVDAWSIGVMLHYMCTHKHVLTTLNESMTIPAVWARFGQPSVEQWPELHDATPALKHFGLTIEREGVNATTPIAIPASHGAVARVISSLLQLNPRDRSSMQEALNDPFWSETPSSEEIAAADKWLREQQQRVASKRPPSSSPRLFDRGLDISILSDASSDAASEAAYVPRAFLTVPDEALRALIAIAHAYELPRVVLHETLLLMDRSPMSLDSISPHVAASAFISISLYLDMKVYIENLADYASVAIDEPDAEEEELHEAVHHIVRATHGRLLSPEAKAAVFASSAWVRVEHACDALLAEAEAAEAEREKESEADVAGGAVAAPVLDAADEVKDVAAPVADDAVNAVEDADSSLRA